jgi:hypothetical protein
MDGLWTYPFKYYSLFAQVIITNGFITGARKRDQAESIAARWQSGYQG